MHHGVLPRLARVGSAVHDRVRPGLPIPRRSGQTKRCHVANCISGEQQDSWHRGSSPAPVVQRQAARVKRGARARMHPLGAVPPPPPFPPRSNEPPQTVPFASFVVSAHASPTCLVLQDHPPFPAHPPLPTRLALVQLVGFMVPFTLAPAFEASPDLATFDSNSLECRSESRVPEFFAFGAMGVLAFTSVVMAFRLRVARVQVCANVSVRSSSSCFTTQ